MYESETIGLHTHMILLFLLISSCYFRFHLFFLYIHFHSWLSQNRRMSKKNLVSFFNLREYNMKMNKRFTHESITIERERERDTQRKRTTDKWEWMIKLSTHMCVISKNQSDSNSKMWKNGQCWHKKSTKFPEFKRLKNQKEQRLPKKNMVLLFYLRNWYYHFLMRCFFLSFRKMRHNKNENDKCKMKIRNTHKTTTTKTLKRNEMRRQKKWVIMVIVWWAQHFI